MADKDANNSPDVANAKLLAGLPDEDNAVRSRCTYCDNPASSFCGRCRFARYCSAACQKKDFLFHKKLCSEYEKSYNSDKRPSPNHVRAIIFPANEFKPAFIWLRQVVVNNGHISFSDMGYLGDYAKDLLGMTELHNVLLDVGHGLLVISRSHNVLPEAPLNKCVMNIGKAGHMKTWFGNQLLVGMKRQSCMEGYASEVAVYDDVDFRDFRHALDYYQQHPANPCIVDSNRDRRPAIPGVILYCDGTQKRLREFGLDVPAEQVRIPRYQTMVLEESVCMRTLQLGLEWGYRRYEPNKEWHKKDINVINMYNDLATSFVQGVTGDMILTPLIYVGTVVLFDNRGAIIQPMHLIGIAAFLDSVANKAVGIELITQPMTKLWEPDPENKSKESQEELEKFWAEWQKDDSIEGFDKRTIVAPTRLKSTLDAEIVGGQFFADVRARLAARDKSGNKNAAA